MVVALQYGKSYFIVPQCAQNMSVGTVGTQDDGNSIVGLRPISDRSSSQRWHLDPDNGVAGPYQFDSDDGATLWFVPPIIGGTTTGPDPDYNAPVSLGPILDTPPELWSYSGRQWNVIPGANPNFFAIQNCWNTAKNLNVAGDGPYPAGTSIMVWDWGGGAPNELWTFIEFD